MKEKVISYLKETYNPETIIIYGSFADGSNNENSDFDAMIIAESDKTHDETEVDGITLDVFIYSNKYFDKEYDLFDFIQIVDGYIEYDNNGLGQRLMKEVKEYINSFPLKTKEEIHQEIEWCNKMYLRTLRKDSEGYYRFHWLLTESLEIYADIKNMRYTGPKKTLKRMEKEDEESYQIYRKALYYFEDISLKMWIDHLNELAGQRENIS